MKIAVISDIHANPEVIQWVADRAAVVVRGNHDNAA
jgi:metallophosphoesterase superfamily enzyme